MSIFKEIIIELKNSKWPKGKEILTLSIYTLIVCVIIPLIILALDLGFYKLREIFLNLLNI